MLRWLGLGHAALYPSGYLLTVSGAYDLKDARRFRLMLRCWVSSRPGQIPASPKAGRTVFDVTPTNARAIDAGSLPPGGRVGDIVLAYRGGRPVARGLRK
jgi:hypothetical protein